MKPNRFLKPKQMKPNWFLKPKQMKPGYLLHLSENWNAFSIGVCVFSLPSKFRFTWIRRGLCHFLIFHHHYLKHSQWEEHIVDLLLSYVSWFLRCFLLNTMGWKVQRTSFYVLISLLVEWAYENMRCNESCLLLVLSCLWNMLVLFPPTSLRCMCYSVEIFYESTFLYW